MTEMLLHGMTASEVEILTMLGEEGSEVSMARDKIMRHGFTSFHPNNPNLVNRTMLRDEVIDILAMARVAINNKIIDDITDEEIDKRIIQKKKFTHFQSDNPNWPGTPIVRQGQV